MRFLAAFVCLIGVAVAGPYGLSTPSGESIWRSGNEYHFKYEGRVLTGMPQLNSQYSGMGIRADIRLQVEDDSSDSNMRVFTIKVQDPRYVAVNDLLNKTNDPADEEESDSLTNSNQRSAVSQYNWRHLVLPQLTPVQGQAKQDLEQPTVFKLRSDSGEFSVMHVSREESEWSINFKKAIVILFRTKGADVISRGGSINSNSINTSGDSSSETMSYWSTTEEGLDGSCKVDYQINEISQAKAQPLGRFFSEKCLENRNLKKYIMVKTRDPDSCSQSSVFRFVKPGYFRCSGNSGNCEGQWTRSSITRYYICGTSATDMQVHTIRNEGEIHQDLLTQNTEKFLTGSQQTLTLIQKTPINNKIHVSSGSMKTIKSLQYSKVHSSGKTEGVLGMLQQGIHNTPSPVEDMINKSLYHSRSIMTVGYAKQGFSGRNQDIDKLKQEVKRVISQLVTDDLVHPKGRAGKEISMKALGLSRALSIFTKDELRSVYQELKGQFASSQENLTTMRNVFFDTTVMGGTENCVAFIVEMIRSGEVENQQILNFLVFLPHYIVTPYERTLESIFELIKSDKIKGNKVIYSQALLSYSALIQRACLSETRTKTYPTEIYGDFCSPHHQIVESKWIPYLQSEIFRKQEQSQTNPEMRNVYLVALSIMRHRAVLPTLLQVLDNQQLNSDDLQTIESDRLTRYIAVYAISNSGKVEPKKTVRVLSAIIKNQSERPEIRIAAFNSLLKLNPDLYVLQSLAALTWRESDQEVIDVINSGFYFLAHQRDLAILEESGSNLRRKASLVLPLIKWSRSLNTMTTIFAKKLDALDVSYSSHDSWRYNSGKNPMSVLPTDYYSRLSFLLNRYQFQVYETVFRMEGYDNFVQQMIEILVPGTEHKTKSVVGKRILDTLSSEWKQVVGKLNIKSLDNEGAQGALFMKVFEDFPVFVNLQSTSTQMLKEKLSSIISNPSSLKDKFCGQHQVNVQRMTDLSPAEFMVPSEMGFPILIEVHMPVTVGLKGSVNVNCGSGQIVPSFDMDLRSVMVSQYTGYVGVVCPFTKEFLVTSADQHLVVDLPFKSSVQVDAVKQEVIVKTSLSEGTENTPFELVHAHVRPFTARAPLYTIQPFSSLPSGQFKVIPSLTPRRSYNYDIGRYIGMGVRVECSTESAGTELSVLAQNLKMFNYNPINFFRFTFVTTGVSERNGQPSLRSHLVKMVFDPSRNSVKEMTFRARVGYASLESSSRSPLYTFLQKASSSEQYPLSYPAIGRLIPVKVERTPLSGSNLPSGHSSRVQKIREMFGKSGVVSGRTIVGELEVDIAGRQASQMKYDFRLTTGQESVQTLKTKWNMELNGNQEKVTMQGHVEPKSGLVSAGSDVDTVRANPMEIEFSNEITVGGSGSYKLKGIAKTSQQQIEYSRVSREGRAYDDLHRRNATLAKISGISRSVIDQATTLDDVRFTVEINNLPMATYAHRLGMSLTKSSWWPYVERPAASGIGSSSSALKDEFHLKFFPGTNSFGANITESTTGLVSTFDRVQMRYCASYTLPLNGVSAAMLLKGQSTGVLASSSLLVGRTNGATKQCKLIGNTLSTYSHHVIPAHMDDCFHVLTGDYSHKYNFQVLARAVESSHPAGDKEIKVNYRFTDIVVGKKADKFQVYVNGSRFEIPKKNEHHDIVNSVGELVATLYNTKDGTLEISTVFDGPSRDSMITMTYTGPDVFVIAETSLGPKMTGMCGQVQSDKLTSLRGPRQCVFSKPELVVASWRVSTPSKQCGPIPDASIRNQLEKEQSQCLKKTIIKSQVSESYKGLLGECTQHMHVLIEKPDSLCVSKLPVPHCSGMCKPAGSGLVSKNVDFVCISKSSKIAGTVKSKVLKGEKVIGELSGQTPSLSMSMSLPKTCTPFSFVSGNQW